MCGASEKPMMMSGPAPEFEVTAVCWLMSSQPTKSTLTSTPVSLLNVAALARNTSSSACTKRTGRSMRRLAPFSISSLGAVASVALMADCAEAPVAANAAAETPKANASRRVISNVIKFSLVFVPGVESPVNSQAPIPADSGALRLFFLLHPAGAGRSTRCPQAFLAALAVWAAIHADRLPAAKRGVLQHRRIHTAYRPHKS